MNPCRQIPARSTWILVAVLATACTAGHVTKNGTPVAGAKVDIWTCEALRDFITTTDAGGNFRFNPFDPSSPAFDSSKYLPEGPIAISITGAAGSSVTRKNHQYTDVCPTAYNGSTQNQPCKVYNINLKPMSLPEFLAELNDFLADDCGLESELAGGLAAAAIARDVREIGRLTTRPSETSCLTDCAQGCLGQSILNFGECMCTCVAVQCEVPFEPFCTETAE